MTTWPLTPRIRAKFADPSARSPSIGDLGRRAGYPAPARRHALSREVILGMTRLHEAVMGRETFRIFRSLDASQWWSTDRLAAFQFEKLRRLLAQAGEHCPYYRGSAYRGLDAIDSEGALAGLPFITRELLRDQARSMCFEAPRRRVLLDHSRGTTDEPVKYFWDRGRQAWDRANRLRGHGWHGFEPGDRELHLWPMDPPVDWGGRVRSTLRQARDILLGDALWDCIRTDETDGRDLQSLWRRFAPARVTSFPSVLFELFSRKALEQVLGRSARPVLDSTRRGSTAVETLPALKCVFLTGEVSHRWQRRLIERMTGARCVQNYGVQEAGAIAFECEMGCWHLCAESAVVEFIHGDRPARDGELAEIVVTSLVNGVMPLVRYRTGDLVRMAGGVSWCRCGRGLPTMPPILGRRADFLRTAAGEWIEPFRITEALHPALEPGSFQVTQRSDRSIDCDVLRRTSPTAEMISRAQHLLREKLGDVRRITIRTVHRLTRTEFGKLRYTRSEIE